MWIMLLLTVLGLLLIAYDVARDSRCEVCLKPFAVFSIVGDLKTRLRVCRRCRRVHHARRRNYGR